MKYEMVITLCCIMKAIGHLANAAAAAVRIAARCHTFAATSTSHCFSTSRLSPLQLSRSVRPSFRALSSSSPDTVDISFVAGGDVVHCKGVVGESILATAHKHNVDLEGACEGSLACSTCHVVLSKEYYEKTISDGEPSDEENDLLDLAYGLTQTSRLGCQVKLTPSMNGMQCKLPEATRNFYVDGHKPKPH